MAIEVRAAGEAKAYGAAGKQIKQNKDIRIAQEQAFELAKQQRAMEWEVQKMTMVSQQEFAHELRVRQAELDKEARAHEWETEKMQIASQVDFERREKERQRKLGVIDSKREAIKKEQEKNGWPDTHPKIQEWTQNLDMMELEALTGVSYPGKNTQDEGLGSILNAFGAGGLEGGTAAPTTSMAIGGAAPGGDFYMRTKDGRIATVTAAEVPEAIEKHGATLMPGQKMPKSEAFQKSQADWMVEKELLAREGVPSKNIDTFTLEEAVSIIGKTYGSMGKKIVEQFTNRPIGTPFQNPMESKPSIPVGQKHTLEEWMNILTERKSIEERISGR